MRQFVVIGAVLLFLVGCRANNTENPAPPESSDIVGASIEEPNVEEPPKNQNTPETLPTGEETPEGVVLNVVSPEVVPEKIKECIDQNVAGEVQEGLFVCNEQSLISCNDLVEAQKKAALDYANEKLPGYNLWGCSVDIEDTPYLHYYMEEGVSLKIFNLAVKKIDAEAT